jgi:hypothetical protein
MNVYNVMIHSFFILESSKKNAIEYESENEQVKPRSVVSSRNQAVKTESKS